MGAAVRVEFEIPTELVEQLATAVAARVESLLDARANPTYMTIEEAAAYLKCSKRHIYNLASQEQDALPHFKLGRRLLFDQREIDNWVAESKIERINRNQPAPETEATATTTSSTPARSRRQSAVRADSESQTKAVPRERRLPPPYSFDEAGKSRAAKALGISRVDFDQVTPREYKRLWAERGERIRALSQDQTDVLFAWDANVEKLSEMSIEEIEALAKDLLQGAP